MHTVLIAFLLILSTASTVRAQSIPPAEPVGGDKGSGEIANPLSSPILPRNVEDKTFAWKPALNQSMRFLLIEHGVRLAFQPGTHRLLGGPFFKDWGESATALEGWGDGDQWLINNVNHPIQGAMSGYIQVQNDPGGKLLEFGDQGYWNSRLRALASNTAYSTQFEMGPISEAAIGNVGLRKGTQGYSDLVVTPIGGFVFMLAEDAIDKWLISKWEVRTASPVKRVFYRVALNPSRSFANLLRGKKPWHRDVRAWPGQ